MLKRERQALILREVNIHNKVLLPDLSQHLNVSEDTVRRDLQELAATGKVIRVRGGALSKSYHVFSYSENEIYACHEKTSIARKAITLLRDGMMILIDGGTTNLELARILPLELKATFFTLSLPIAMQLVKHPACEIIFVGGKLSKNAKISTGGEVIQQLLDIRPDLCFLSTNGIDAERGVTDSDWELVNVKKAMIKAASKIAVLTISEKLNSTRRIKVCSIKDVDLLVTELSPEHELLEPYSDSKLSLL